MVKIPLPASIIPPLTNGDKLTRYEFERRYNAVSKPKKAELIEGIVYIMPAALRFRSHGQPHGRILTWLGNYEAMTPGVALGVEPTVRLDLDNEPQPDAVLIIIPEAGGQTRISEDDYIEGPPELVVEIAASSVAIDLHGKKQAYRRNGVREYIVWQVLDEKLSWFSLQEGEYLELAPNEEGVLQSRVFPGLWLAVNELLTGNMQVVLNVLQTGLQSVEHADFIKCFS
ncbi:Uma2 family endonuclease [Dolichospermum circinale CS-1225]|uniref:Uma2 family endonuclease n=1 Tax=Dolichospermum circinale CS-537/01 TaxID=3021739 RepID=A0ABT5A5Y2_9CYAN|nr:Uma2 family endonuclease [Dolichospermum circinale]MDB9460476.1 Uma2 family endonuclease [Dolichospermum circinale CS-545/17]MDB9465651.1 Uma2 family endonuclease [Dolichospermum circinale CS-539/09]MDB9469747.1 Uma2 family endonuclease [Dolichospermum circinale CS-539]MDB9487351.1 Uma2 family endonuclease [Dolichospermum circinale CS-537/01]MDB9522015.1 Uma2 family endonuclease [Dolichospermum circinale CS-1225]